MAASEPAIWKALQLPGVGHYCLISELTGDGLPTMPEKFKNVEAWWQYCRDHNTVAQRNINIVDDIKDGKVETWLDLLNPGSSTNQHQIEAICNVPENSTVALYCPSNKVKPPISTGKVTINATNNGQVVSAQPCTFPKDFQGTLEITFVPPADAPSGDYSITAKQYVLDGGKMKHLGSYTFKITI
jgi:hypothetical protein